MTMRESRARALFEEIYKNSDPAAVLKSWVKSKKQESDFLEFKGGRIADTKRKDYWSQALSGFANTEGGVLVLGIRAAKVESTDDSSRKIDAASDLDLVPKPDELMQWLKDVKLEVTNPPVAGVEYGSYDAGEGDGSGFVVCFVPEGLDKPYRAELDSHRQYYQRIGDSFRIINHSMLRSLFYPQTAPCFEMDVKLDEVKQLPDGPRGVMEYRFWISVRNVGTASARDTVVAVRCNYDMTNTYEKSPFRSIRSPINRREAEVTATRPIHRLEDMPCLCCYVRAPANLHTEGAKADDVANPTRIAFVISVYALDTRPFRGSVAFDSHDAGDVSQQRKNVRKKLMWET